MQYKFYKISLLDSAQSEEELNKFLRSHRVLTTERHFCPDNGGYWAVAVEYADQNPLAEVPPAHRRDKDVTAGMSEEEKARFEHFRTIRRQISTANGIPAYTVFTNEELASLARVPELRADTVKDVKGIAPARLKNYVESFFVVTDGETGRQPDAEDMQS
ncbi:MAG: HRDC domain-containing protein [Prevotella sp.]|nr:HRDC domain-containing protein [Prevotella sp.]